MSDALFIRTAEYLFKYTRDPLGFVLDLFPWGQPGTVLEHAEGPDTWQQDILTEIRDSTSLDHALQIAISSGHGVGKGSNNDLVITCPSGNKRWGDIKVGDSVFGIDGKPTKVIATNSFSQAPFYRVTFDDGSFCDVSSGHLWTVRGRQERRKGLDGWRTLETCELVRLGVKRPNGSAMARQWEIPTTAPVDFPPKKTLLHPYLMGIWLGDGTVGQPRYTKPYEEIAEKLRLLGYDVSDPSENNGSRYIRNIKFVFQDGVFQCRSPERYIPDEYKFGDVSARMELFRGLCDSDGEAPSTGTIGYSTTSKRLADDVIWLARSLGCKAKLQPTIKKTWYPGPNGERIECKDCYRISINAPFNPFTVEHRKLSYKPSEARYTKRWIDSIEPLGCKDGMCIQVDRPDGLYLTNDFIVTHNSCLVSWLILWAMSTKVNTRGVVTANTDVQLKTKTWVELSKWYELAPVLHPMFELTATGLRVRDESRREQWRLDRITWSDKNTEAFAGLHNQGRRIIVIFDEGSSIPDVIWEVTEGALTDKDTEILWLVCGNPTRSTGRFRECWGKFKDIWKTHQVDSRTVRITNKQQIARWAATYGEDSDFFRVRVRGVFPRVGSMQFIPTDLVQAAVAREAQATIWDPFIMGVDVARFGDDSSVVCFRRGRDARTIPWLRFSNVDTYTLSTRIIEEAKTHQPDAIFIDEGGVGAGVVDRLKFLKLPVIGVQFGSAPDRGGDKRDGAVAYANKRAEMWGTMKDWLRGGAIPNEVDLYDGLVNVEYGYRVIHGQDCIQLEKKEDMKRRGFASPDAVDALALTFAFPVMPSDHRDALSGKNQSTHQHEYDPFADGWRMPNT